MIWTTDAAGGCIYVCEEWTKVTGQPVREALGNGWLDAVHVDDVPCIMPVRNAAFRSQQPFTMTYRLRSIAEGFIWIIDGAAPSIAPPEETFLGFLGRAVRSYEHMMKAGGHLGRHEPTPLHVDTIVTGVLDQIADNLLMAHALAMEEKAAFEIVNPLREAMWRSAIALAQSVEHRSPLRVPLCH